MNTSIVNYLFVIACANTGINDLGQNIIFTLNDSLFWVSVKR